MIIHGNKQISERLYARKSSEGGGAVRLTNIIRGAQVVFGGLIPKVTWLYPPTRAAILAAFGQTDGKAVIKATNAYLKALAATDKTKASALAGLINKHPLDAALYGGLYVQDGLVFQMDRAYECTAAKWTDFIGGVEFDGTNVQIMDDGVPKFTSSGYYTTQLSALGYPYETSTLELVFNVESWGQNGSFDLFYSPNEVCMRVKNSTYNNNKINYGDRVNVFAYGCDKIIELNSLTRLSVNMSTGFILDGIKYSNGGVIGGKVKYSRVNIGNMIGKIYAIRIYNRLLTEQEILANQDIDLKRFTTISLTDK